MRFSLCKTLIISALFLFLVNHARAGLILNHPNYTGLNQGLVGFWSFDGKDMAGFPIGANPATAYDRSGQGNDGKYYNATGTQPVAGKIGQALNFDGVNDYVSIPDADAIDFATDQNFAVSFWVKMGAGNAANDAMVEKRAETQQYSYAFRLSGAPLDVSFCRSDITFAPCVSSLGSGMSLTDQSWHHIVGIKNGVNLLLYYDGSFISTTIDTTVGDVTNALNVYLGERGDNTRQFAGVIDELRIYNRALSADEIKRLYRIGGTLHVNTQINNDSLQKGLIGHWDFDGKNVSVQTAINTGSSGENGIVYDCPPPNYTCTAKNADRLEGKIGQALNFNSTSSTTVRVTSPSGLDLVAVPLTMSYWAYPTDVSVERGVLVNPGQYCSVLGAGNLYLNDGGLGQSINTAYSFANNNWYFITQVVGNDLRASQYINGVLVGGPTDISWAGIDTGDTLNIGSTVWLEEGAGASACRTVNFFQGRLDDVRIYNRALSSEEIKRLYRIGGTLHVNTQINNDTLKNGLVGYWSFDGKDTAGFPIGANPATAYDRSGNGNDGLYYNATGTQPFIGKIGQALKFNGASYISTTNVLSFAGGYTLTAWFKTTTSYTVSTWAGLIGVSDAGFGEIFIIGVGNGIGYGADNGAFAFNKTGGNAFAATSARTGLNDGKWHLIVGGRDNSNNAFVSVDNEPIVTASGFSGTITPGIAPSIGTRTFGAGISSFFNGSIDDVRIYNRALTGDEIKRLYQIGGGR